MFLITYCCCFNLRTGSIIVGVISLVLTAIFLILSSILISLFPNSIRYSILYINAFAYVLGGILDIVMIVGVVKKKPYFMLPYIIAGFVGFCLFSIAAVVLLISISFGLGFKAIFATFEVILWIRVACVYSHYKQLKQTSIQLSGDGGDSIVVTYHTPVDNNHTSIPANIK